PIGLEVSSGQGPAARAARWRECAAQAQRGSRRHGPRTASLSQCDQRHSRRPIARTRRVSQRAKRSSRPPLRPRPRRTALRPALARSAKPAPLRDQVRVNTDQLDDILDQLRSTIPEEIKQARWIAKERDDMLAQATREAERIVKETRERQAQLVAAHELPRQAE